MCWLSARSELKIFGLASSSERSLTPYWRERARAISSASIESRPSPSPKSGAFGAMSSGRISISSVVTINRASSSSCTSSGNLSMLPFSLALQGAQLRPYCLIQVLDPAVVVLVDGLALRVVVEVAAVLVLDAVGLRRVLDVDRRHVLAHVERAKDQAGLHLLHLPAERGTGANDRFADLVERRIGLACRHRHFRQVVDRHVTRAGRDRDRDDERQNYFGSSRPHAISPLERNVFFTAASV